MISELDSEHEGQDAMERRRRRPIIRWLGRWWRRTIWFLSVYVEQLGLGRRGRLPLWLRDNPFFTRTVRQSARGPILPLQCGMIIAALGILLYYALNLQSHYRTNFRLTATFLFHTNSRGLILAAVMTVHWIIVSFLRMSSLTRNAQDQRRRHWLTVLSTVPAYRPELVFAEAIASTVRRMYVHIAALPIYVILMQLAGADAILIACFYAVLFFSDFSIMPVPPPSTAGTTDIRKAFLNVRTPRVKHTSATVISTALSALVFFLITVSWIPATGLSRWSMHFFAPVHLGATVDIVRLTFTFPYVLSNLLMQPVEFFGGYVPPWTYVVLIALLLRLTAGFEVAAAVGALEGGERADGGALRRARLLIAASLYAISFTILGYAWRAWVISGDTATFIGARPVAGANIAGLYLLLGFLAAPLAAYRAATLPTHTRTGTPRRTLGMARRYLKAGGRIVAPLMLVPFLVCVCGGRNPLPPIGLICILRIGAATAVTAIFAAGLKRLVTAVKSTRSRPRVNREWFPGFLFVGGPAIAVAALFTQPPFARLMGACLPYYSWFQIYPGAESAFHGWHALAQATGVMFAPPPGFGICLLLPALTGVALWTVATPLSKQMTVQAPPSTSTHSSKRAAPTASVTWVARYLSNPIFLRDLSKSLPNPLLQPLQIVGAVVLMVAGFTWYQVKFSQSTLFVTLGLPQQVIDNPIALALMASVVILTVVTFVMLAAAGYWAGERILSDEFEQGALGALLITPLRDSQIVLARIAGRLAGTIAGPFVIAVCSFGLVGIAVADPVNAGFEKIWVDAQLVLAMLFCCGIAGGTIVSTMILRRRWLRGASLLAAFVGPAIMLPALTGSISALYSDQPADGIALRVLAYGTLISVGLAALGIVFACAQFRRLRRGDIDYGDQPGK